MTEKKMHASEYEPGFAEIVRSTCLLLATKLGDLMDNVVIVGGLAPARGH